MKVLTYRNKIIGIGVCLVFVACLVLAIMIGAVYKINVSNQFSEFAEEFSKSIYKCDIDTKNFFLEIYIDHKRQENNHAQQNLKNVFNSLKSRLAKANLDDNFDTEKQKIRSSILQIETAIEKIDTCYKLRGFKDSGYEGKMRAAIHSLEDKLQPEFMTLLLTLRRHEKDFFLRKDVAYIDKFNKTFSEFKSKINTDKLLYANLLDYDLYFKKIVEIETQIGLKQNAGLQLQLFSNYAIIEQICDEILVRSNTKKLQAWNFLIVSSLVLSLLIIGLILICFFSYRFFNSQIVVPSIKLTEISKNLANGNLDVTINKTEKQSFLEEIIGSFNIILTDYKSSFETMQNYIKDENAKKREVRSNQDLVTIKLNDLHQTLENQRAIQKNRVWFDSGIKQVSEMLYQADLMDELPQHIVTFFVKHLNANQAAIFVKDFENQEVEFIQTGTYAYGRKKYVTSNISLKEGLVGQCADEKETIFMTDVPQNYIKITSGLGEATPRCVAIVPFMQNNEVVAVLEICSFSVFTSHEIQFLETAGKNIASAFLNQNLILKTKKLLLESQNNINIMSSSEEELRQNLEEMNAIQEDFNRKEVKYISELEITKQEFNAEKEQLINLLEEYKTKNEHQSLQNNHLHLQFEKEKKVFVAKIQEMQRVIYKNHLHDVKNAVDLVENIKPIQKKYPRSIEFYLDA